MFQQKQHCGSFELCCLKDFSRRSVDMWVHLNYMHTPTQQARARAQEELHQITQRVDCQTTDPHSNSHIV